MYMKKLVISFLLLFAVFNAIAQESFFRGNNNYVAPTIVLPTISTSAITNINRYGAISGGTIIDNGGAPILSSGICWSATSNLPTITDNKTTDGLFSLGTFASSITGLTAGVAYKVRAFATNTAGTSYGSVQSFTTTPILIQTAVLIGTQVWTDKNLNVANYRNGDAITYAADATQWNNANNAGEGAYTYLKFASGDGGARYGKLYNWFAVNDSRGLAPVGYHIPTLAEWITLRNTQPYNGTTLKSNTNDWSASFSNVNNNLTVVPDVNYSLYNGNNSSGFNTLPGGSIFPNGTNGNYGSASFWTATPDASNPLKAEWMYFHSVYFYVGSVCCFTYEKGNGMAVRLVKDNNIIETAATTPVLASTTTATSITSSSAILGGNVTDEGLTQATSRGLVYGTSAGSSTFTVTIGSGAGTFTTTLTGLTQGTRYYVRSFATNVQGTGYGAETSFTTQTTATVSATASVTSITGTTATSGGTITTDGGATVTSRGLVWGTTAGASTYSVTTGTGTGTYTASLTGLSIATTYFVRAFAVNSVGTTYGPEVQFATPSTATVASTITSTITSSTAILGGVLSSTGGATTSVGIMYTTNADFSGTYTTTTISLNANAGTFTNTITGLTAVTNYKARTFATNTAGTTYGPEISFTTPVAPIAVGDFYGGGIVYYVLQSGDNGYDANVQHGLIAQPQNEIDVFSPLFAGITWNVVALNNNTISGAQNSGTLLGRSNTAAIIANQGAGTYLFKYVSLLNINGYNDWYVPSLIELNKFRDFLYNPTYIINNTSTHWYWISKNNSNYKWTWGTYVSSTQAGQYYKGNYVEGNGVSNISYNYAQGGNNYVYLAIRSF